MLGCNPKAGLQSVFPVLLMSILPSLGQVTITPDREKQKKQELKLPLAGLGLGSWDACSVSSAELRVVARQNSCLGTLVLASVKNGHRMLSGFHST